jgi:hypothetical protein
MAKNAGTAAMTDNAPEIRRMNVRAVRASIDFFKYLTVRGGRLIRNGNRYTLEVGGGIRGSGRWSGIYEAAGRYYDQDGEHNSPVDADNPWKEPEARCFGVRINNPVEYEWTDNPSAGSLTEWQWYYVADKNEDTQTYTWSSRTTGDIHVRTT